MGDYLGNLVAKSLDQTEVAKPRPVSRFEPSPLSGGPSAAHPLALDAVDDGQMTPDALVAPQWVPAEHPLKADLRLPADPKQQWRRGSSAKLFLSSDPPAGRPPSAPVAPEPVKIEPKPDRVLSVFPPAMETAVPTSTPQAHAGLTPAQEWSPREPLPLPTATFQTVTNGNEMDDVQPSGMAEREGQPAAEPLAQPPVVEPTIPPVTPAPTNAVSVQSAAVQMMPPSTPTPTKAVSAQSAAEKESRAALEPAAAQLAIERTVAPAAPPLRVEDRSRRRRTALWDDEPRAEGESDRSPSIIVPTSAEMRPGLEAVVAQPRVEPAQRSEPPPALPAEPMPTIQVTIGRVEVRATPPPVAALKKHRPNPAVMSLDEYLRQRANGGDR